MFYDARARVLPWREEPSPYRVFVSEVMLQQTRIEAALPYFERFVAALPDLRALSLVPEDRLLKLWEGLGYYNRARNLKKAAAIALERYGSLPGSYEEIKTLPGMGEYSAGAVASIAFGERVPAIDGNVLRVFARLLCDESEPSSPLFKARVREILEEAIPPSRAGDFNQALMELGATVCIPSAPRCKDCPVPDFCAARRAGREKELPQKKKKPSRRLEEKTVALCMFEDKIAARKREKGSVLAGMWEFLTLEGALSKEELRRELKSRGMQPGEISPLGPKEHIFTHIQWKMEGYLVRLSSSALPEGMRLFSKEALEREVSIPSAFLKYYKKI